MMKRYFDISRKIIASTTTDSWRNVPHCGIIYDADAEKLTEVIREYNGSHSKAERITINSAMLKVIIEGIKAAPAVNGHISYSHRFVSGCVMLLDHIDISTPIVYGDGRMMTVTLPHMEDKSICGIQSMMNDYRRRVENTDMDAVMYQAGLNDTFDALRHGRFIKTAGRLAGAKLGKCRVSVSRERMRKSRLDGQSGRSLTPEDIRQGSITVSSVGPLYRNWKGHCTMLQVVPPQLCAVAIGTMQKKPVADADDAVVVKKIIPVTITHDHRATDFSDLVPMLERMDEVLASEEIIKALI